MTEVARQRADALAWAHPIVREWFLNRFGSATEPQVAGWPEILANRDALISAPTGSGKTLAAFLACIDRLVRRAATGELGDRTSVLYVSPLKALGNDIQKTSTGRWPRSSRCRATTASAWRPSARPCARVTRRCMSGAR